MIDYKKMYALVCGAASDSLDILRQGSDEQSILSVQFLLQQALMKAENVYIKTSSGNYPAEEQS
ncbi:hypothetical protein LJB77_01820 [Ruminococcaceae bacterium OttesenSCG-928-N02]|nr:hypothetical protein [Ruminococcaceae bacterium OttesenSCG-928-N02]